MSTAKKEVMCNAAQAFSAAEQAQGRANIGAASSDGLESTNYTVAQITSALQGKQDLLLSFAYMQQISESVYFTKNAEITTEALSGGSSFVFPKNSKVIMNCFFDGTAKFINSSSSDSLSYDLSIGPYYTYMDYSYDLGASSVSKGVSIMTPVDNVAPGASGQGQIGGMSFSAKIGSSDVSSTDLFKIYSSVLPTSDGRIDLSGHFYATGIIIP